MDSALVIGGTRFVGRHLVEDLLAHDYSVTLLTRGESPNPFHDRDQVRHVTGDRNDRNNLDTARERAEPDLVVDTCAYHPGQVETATEVFADVEGYVYVSSGSAYADDDIPLREDDTRLHDCTAAEATDDSMESYGPRKAEGDRVVARAAARGVRAMSVRPMLVYGPHDYTERLDYWIDQIATRDRVLVPGDGDSLLHRAYVKDVASALRIVGEAGAPGQAYNVADRTAHAIDPTLEAIADALGADVELVHASPRDLDDHDLDLLDFPHVAPQPALAATDTLAALGWTSRPFEDAIVTTVEEHLESDRDGAEVGPGPDAVTDVLASLDAR